MRTIPPPDRAAGIVLRCYPRNFRERFGAGMRHAFDQDYAAAAARGPAARRRFVAAALLRAACFGTLERLPKGPVMRSFIQFDLTAAIRSLRATPVITAVAIASLALGIGANTALFSILNGLVLKPLPVRAPQDLAFIDDGDWTNPIWEAVRERAPEFADGACLERDELRHGGQRRSGPRLRRHGERQSLQDARPDAGARALLRCGR
jgi:hypothetical protein